MGSRDADEFQTCAGVSEGTWRELLSRGRRYGLALTLAHQYPSQLPEGLRDEIFGNVASLIAFGLSAKDAQAVRKELLELPLLPVDAEPVSLEALVTLRTGQAIARLGGGAYGLKLRPADPVPQPKVWRGEKTRIVSWERYGREVSRDFTTGLHADQTHDRARSLKEDGFLE